MFAGEPDLWAQDPNTFPTAVDWDWEHKISKVCSSILTVIVPGNPSHQAEHLSSRTAQRGMIMGHLRFVQSTDMSMHQNLP